jgi:hypothetical protein
MNMWLEWVRSVLPRAGAFRVYVDTMECSSCGTKEKVARVMITKATGKTGALYLCEDCVEAIRLIV